MSSIRPSPNGLLHALPAAELETRGPRLQHGVTFRAMVARHVQARLALAQQSAACGGETLPLTQESLAQPIGVKAHHRRLLNVPR